MPTIDHKSTRTARLLACSQRATKQRERVDISHRHRVARAVAVMLTLTAIAAQPASANFGPTTGPCSEVCSGGGYDLSRPADAATNDRAVLRGLLRRWLRLEPTGRPGDQHRAVLRGLFRRWLRLEPTGRPRTTTGRARRLGQQRVWLGRSGHRGRRRGGPVHHLGRHAQRRASPARPCRAPVTDRGKAVVRGRSPAVRGLSGGPVARDCRGVARALATDDAATAA